MGFTLYGKEIPFQGATPVAQALIYPLTNCFIHKYKRDAGVRDTRQTCACMN